MVNLSGNTFTGGIEEAVISLKINMPLDPNARIGCPAAGTYNAVGLDRVLSEAQTALPSARTSY